MNGVSNAFMRELNCAPCPQCSDDKPRANTSGSLLIKTSSGFERHLLFDCGIGVVDSLIDFGIRRVDYIFNTHNHFDHVAGLDRLLNSLRRNPSGGQPKTPLFYSTSGTWNKGILEPYGYLANWVEWRNINPQVASGASVPLEDLGIGLSVTPFPVYHGPYAYEPVIFVVEFGSGDTRRKLVLCWDLLHLVMHHPAPPDDWFKVRRAVPGSHGYPTDDRPQLPEQQMLYTALDNPTEGLGPEDLTDRHKLLFGADEFIVEGNTALPNFCTGHISIIGAMELVRRSKPKRTWVVHYSGHEDCWGPMSDEELQNWINVEKRYRGIEDQDIRVARHGMTLTYAL